MVRVKRKYHPKFKEYMKFIANHPNYKNMLGAYKKDDSVRWVVAGNSKLGKERLRWWDKKRQELGIPKNTKWISKVARAIHPIGEKPCQICGRVMKLDYVYPNKKGTMSPGAMSNAPDRFDGFHSYNLCCRGEQDRGRHKENLQRYGEDRRAYEYWVDGDWKAASWLMQVFRKNNISPDHVGPISLGFCHQPKFNPMTIGNNIAKGNRMSLIDVKTLKKDEQKGEKIVSWHSKYIWDKLKNKIKNSEDALILSKLMRKNMHYVLNMLYQIHSFGYDDFLVRKFLNLRYAYFSVSFDGFDPETGKFDKIIKKKGTKKQYKNNAERYIRKSMISLEKYSQKTNRRLTDWKDSILDLHLKQILSYLKNEKESEAEKMTIKILKRLAEKAEKEFDTATKHK